MTAVDIQERTTQMNGSPVGGVEWFTSRMCEVLRSG